MAPSWQTKLETQVKQNKTGFQTLATVFTSRPRRKLAIRDLTILGRQRDGYQYNRSLKRIE
jgi:hypothetical protein